MEIASAGVLITDGTLVLAGYHPKNQMISGIGGKSLADETPSYTAAREMLEELFGIVPSKLLTTVYDEILSEQPYKQSGSYTFYIVSFEVFESILQLLWLARLKTPLYEKTPLTMKELVQKRIITKSSEITYLYLLPLTSNLQIDPSFKQDLEQIR